MHSSVLLLLLFIVIFDNFLVVYNVFCSYFDNFVIIYNVFVLVIFDNFIVLVLTKALVFGFVHVANVVVGNFLFLNSVISSNIFVIVIPNSVLVNSVAFVNLSCCC